MYFLQFLYVKTITAETKVCPIAYLHNVYNTVHKTNFF